MNRKISFLVKTVGVMLFGTIFSTLSASNHNVYFSDPSAGMIYGMADDASGQSPAMVSGQLAFNAFQVTQYDNNHLVMTPQYHREKIVEIDFLTKDFSKIYSMPYGWQVAALGPGLTPTEFTVLACHLENRSLQIYAATRSNGNWTFTPKGTEFSTVSVGDYCQILTLSHDKFVVRHYESVEMVDTSASTQNSFIRSTADRDYLVNGPNGVDLWYIAFSASGTGAAEFYDYSGSLIDFYPIPWMLSNHPSIPYLDWTLWQSWTPTFLGKAKNQLYTEEPPYEVAPTLVYSAHTGDGSPQNPVDLEKDIQFANNFFYTATNTWDYYDTFQNNFYTINTDADTLTQRVILEAGSGPPLGSVLAMDTTPSGQIHALCEQIDKLEIISVNPSFGQRTLQATNLSKDFYPAISCENDGSYHLFREAQVNNEGILETYLELCQLTLGSQPDDYSISIISSVQQTSTVLDTFLTKDGIGAVLYPMNSELFLAQSDGTSLSTYSGIPGYEKLQGRGAAILSSGEIKLYGVLPPSLWDYNPDTPSLSQTELFFNGGATLSALNYPADFVSSPDESVFYISSFLSPNIYEVNATSGEASLFADGRPDKLSGDIWGAPSLSSPAICCGPYIKLPYADSNASQNTSWFLH